MITLTPTTWLISDTHWKHKNIIAFCNRPPDCDAQMVVNWQRLVRPTDDILHLGDLAFGIGHRPGIYETMLATLRGRKFLLKGNHDKRTAAFYRTLGFELLDPALLAFAPTDDSRIKETLVLRQTVLGRRLALSHVPLKDDGSWDLHLHGHIHYSYEIPDPKWVNLSVEVRGYRPVQLGSLVKTSRRAPSRRVAIVVSNGRRST